MMMLLVLIIIGRARKRGAQADDAGRMNALPFLQLSHARVSAVSVIDRIFLFDSFPSTTHHQTALCLSVNVCYVFSLPPDSFGEGLDKASLVWAYK